MKITQIAPLMERVPPTLYGGTERAVSWLTEELMAKGQGPRAKSQEVTLFASGDSRTAAKLVPIVVPFALLQACLGPELFFSSREICFNNP